MTAASQRIPWKIFSLILAGAFIGPFGAMAVNVSLPTVARDIQTDIQSVKWVILMYLLVTTFILPVAGRFSRFISEEKLYGGGLLVAACGTLLSGFTPEGGLGFLVSARGLTAVGTAAVFALFSSLLAKYIPASRRGLGFGLVGATVAVALVAGVLAGSAISEFWGWRWAFLVQTPLQAGGFIAALAFFPPTTSRRVVNYPWPSAFGWLLTTCGLVLVLDAYAKGLLIEWLPLTITLMVGGLLLFIFMERRGNPLFDYSLFASAGYRLGVIGIALINLVFFIVTLFIPFYLEEYLGMSPQEMGRYLAIIPLATLVVAPLAGRYSDKHGARLPVLSGLILAAAGFAWMSAVGFSGNVRDIIAGLLLLGIAGGLFNSPLLSLMMGSVSDQMRGIASGLGSLARNLGFMLGTSLGSLSLSLFLWRYGGVELMRVSQHTGLTPESVSFDAFQFALRGMMAMSCVICLIGLALMARLPNQPPSTS